MSGHRAATLAEEAAAQRWLDTQDSRRAAVARHRARERAEYERRLALRDAKRAAVRDATRG